MSPLASSSTSHMEVQWRPPSRPQHRVHNDMEFIEPRELSVAAGTSACTCVPSVVQITALPPSTNSSKQSRSSSSPPTPVSPTTVMTASSSDETFVKKQPHVSQGSLTQNTVSTTCDDEDTTRSSSLEIPSRPISAISLTHRSTAASGTSNSNNRPKRRLSLEAQLRTIDARQDIQLPALLPTNKDKDHTLLLRLPSLSSRIRTRQNVLHKSSSESTGCSIATISTTATGNVQALDRYSALYRGCYDQQRLKHGHGELVWANGDHYVGDFCHGRRNGRGRLQFATVTDMSSPPTTCGAPSHQANRHHAHINRRQSSENSSDNKTKPRQANNVNSSSSYNGLWLDNQMHGHGTRHYPNGDLYRGDFQNGVRHGQGRLHFANGDLYLGGWQHNQMHGFGRYYYATGNQFAGHYTHGQREGQGKLQRADGTTEFCFYVNNVRAGEGVRWMPPPPPLEQRRRSCSSTAVPRRVYRLVDGVVTGRITEQEAAEVVAAMEQLQMAVQLPAHDWAAAGCPGKNGSSSARRANKVPTPLVVTVAYGIAGMNQHLLGTSSSNGKE